MHRGQAALLVSVAALAAASCGGSSSKSSTNSVRGIKGPPETARTASTPAVIGSTSTTSGGSNTASSNGFCNQLSQALGQLVSNTGPDVSKQIAGMQAARDNLRALNPPAPAAGDYAKFISALTTWINDLESRKTSAAQQDSGTVIANEHAASRAAGCR
jgi:hypothetical protein